MTFLHMLALVGVGFLIGAGIPIYLIREQSRGHNDGEVDGE